MIQDSLGIKLDLQWFLYIKVRYDVCILQKLDIAINDK